MLLAVFYLIQQNIMKSFEQIKKLRKNAEAIKSLFNDLIPKWQADPKHYDKTRFGFKEGGSDGWYKSCESLIHFEAWCGTYGDSSTYSQISMDGDVFKVHFLKYLNANKKEIMMAVADSIEKEAKSLKEKAEEEVKAQLSELAELENVE